MTARPFLIFGDTAVSYADQTMTYIENGFANECWERCKYDKKCCRVPLLDPAVADESEGACEFLPCGEECPDGFINMGTANNFVDPFENVFAGGTTWNQVVQATAGSIAMGFTFDPSLNVNPNGSTVMPGEHLLVSSTAGGSFPISIQLSRPLEPCENILINFYDVDLPGENIIFDPTNPPLTSEPLGSGIVASQTWADATPMIIQHVAPREGFAIGYQFQIVERSTKCCPPLNFDSSCVELSCDADCPIGSEETKTIEECFEPAVNIDEGGGLWNQIVNGLDAGPMTIGFDFGNGLNVTPNGSTVMAGQHFFVNAPGGAGTYDVEVALSRPLEPCEELKINLYDVDEPIETVNFDPNNPPDTTQNFASGFTATATFTNSSSMTLEHVTTSPNARIGYQAQILQKKKECCPVNPLGSPINAAWFDPNNPCSAEYLGMLIEDISYSGAYSRNLKDTLNGGAIGNQNLNAREIEVTGWIVSASECGTQYGIEYLNNIFNDEGCDSVDCNYNTLKVSLCCDGEDDNKGLKTLRRVKSLGPVEEIDTDVRRCCGAKVRIKFAAEDPIFYSPSEILATSVYANDAECVPNWCCFDCEDTQVDWPICGDIDDGVFDDAIISKSEEENCFCEPMFVKSVCMFIEGDPIFPTFVDWSISAVYDIRNVSISLLNDVDGQDPLQFPDVYRCQEEAASQISFIPSNHTLNFFSGGEDLNLSNNSTGEEVAPLGIGTVEQLKVDCQDAWICFKFDACVNDLDTTFIDVSTQTGTL